MLIIIWSQLWHRKLKILSPRTDHDTCSLTTFRVYFSSKNTKENDKIRTKKRIFIYKILGFQNCVLAENHPYIVFIKNKRLLMSYKIFELSKKLGRSIILSQQLVAQGDDFFLFIKNWLDWFRKTIIFKYQLVMFSL